MIIKSDQKPKLCLDRDMRIVDSLYESITVGEPACAIGVKGSGKNIIFTSLIKKLSGDSKFISLHATQKKELEKVIPLLRSQSNTIFILNISTHCDISNLINEIGRLRELHGNQFVPIILTYINSVTNSLINNHKILFRNMYVIDPISFEDSNNLLGDFARRYQFKLNKEQQKSIYEISGGNVGIFKSLYLYQKDNPKLIIKNNLQINPSLLFRIKAIIDDISNLELNDPDLLHLFSIKDKDKFTIPIVNLYIKNMAKDHSLTNFFTKNESDAYQLLESNKDKIVDRQELAITIWSQEVDEKYSDWAIDQIIHRIRKKLVSMNSPYKIITKKGRGFMLTTE